MTTETPNPAFEPEPSVLPPSPPSAATDFKPAHVDALTSPRFLFGLYVLIKHAGWAALKEAGVLPKPIDTFMSNAEVSISYFFTMSGFVLAYVYMAKFAQKGSLGRYARARFSRVYPVFLLSLVLMIPFVPWVSLAHDLPQFFLLQSWVPGVWADGSVVSNWNMQSWTLSVELFCYITFPWTIRWLEMRSTRAIVGSTVAICVLMVALRLPGYDEPVHALSVWQTYLPFPLIRWPEFIYGILLAIIYRRGAAPKSPLTLHLLLIVVVVLLLTVHSLWLYGPLAVMSGIIVLLLTTSSTSSPLNGILTHPIAVMLGRASYSLYILQLPIYLILHAAFPTGWFAKLAYVPLMIGLSIVVFFVYEEPMHRWLRGAKPKKMAAPLS
ncbi:acyltransferase [Sphingomonas bacterium]|uniref:acyltransferase family protein n=1 Tax=Sphingomonas bacterium TaxID=1895847 RepID=UPI00262D5778|nr:acyltransferase [Sphingomonas bacterium]MDB5677427.1 hypothetical protein [Sphingomonas bacterium]